jgi:hypothetical protein
MTQIKKENILEMKNEIIKFYGNKKSEEQIQGMIKRELEIYEESPIYYKKFIDDNKEAKKSYLEIIKEEKNERHLIKYKEIYKDMKRYNKSYYNFCNLYLELKLIDFMRYYKLIFGKEFVLEWTNRKNLKKLRKLINEELDITSSYNSIDLTKKFKNY